MDASDSVIVLFGHGSRDPLWSQLFDAVAARVQAADPAAVVCCAYLEHTRPGLAEALEPWLVQGCPMVRIVPIFLGPGRHVLEDLPSLVQQLRHRYPGTQFHIQPAVGEDPRLLDAIGNIALH